MALGEMWPDGPAVDVEAYELAQQTLASDGNLQGYWKLENTSDSGPNGYTLTNTGSIAFSSAKFGNGAILDGSTKYLTIADGSCANLEISGSQTWMCWFYPKAIGVTHQILSKRKLSNSGAYRLISLNNDNTFNFNISGLTTNTEAKSVMTPTVNTWHHIAGVYDSANSKLKIWVNGVKTEFTASGSGTDTNAPFDIGAVHLGAGDTANGFSNSNIDDVSIFNRALTDDEVLAQYRERKGLYALWHLSDVNDSSGNGYTLTNTNTVSFNPGKFGLGADGGSGNTNKRLSTSNTLGINGTPCTIMGWFKITGSTFPMILAQQTNNTSKTFNRFYMDNSTSAVFQRNKIGSASQDFTASFTPGNNWNHFAYTYDGATVRGYINSSLVGSVTANGNGVSSSTEGFVIGANESGALVLQGISDEVLVYGRALSEKEIKKYYKWTTGKFAQVM